MNLCRIGGVTYERMYRTVRCDHCGARAGEKCRGFRGRGINAAHLNRKRRFAEWRKANYEDYLKLRRETSSLVAGTL